MIDQQPTKTSILLWAIIQTCFMAAIQTWCKSVNQPQIILSYIRSYIVHSLSGNVCNVVISVKTLKLIQTDSPKSSSFKLLVLAEKILPKPFYYPYLKKSYRIFPKLKDRWGPNTPPCCTFSKTASPKIPSISLSLESLSHIRKSKANICNQVYSLISILLLTNETSSS